MTETTKIGGKTIIEAIVRVCEALLANSEYLTGLDQAMGDGDLGINMMRIATALQNYCISADTSDLGKFFMSAGMETNKAAPSTMGTLIATALMRGGKEVKGLNELSGEDLVVMFLAATNGIQERGKANLGDKTILDAMVPAANAFSTAINDGVSIPQAAEKMVTAAVGGRDHVTPLRSRIGRASWVGERTEGLVDPGCETLVVILKAMYGKG